MNQKQIHWNGLKVGDLEIGETIATGAFSTVYKAVDKSGTFAIKVAGEGFGGGESDTGFFSSHAVEHITSGAIDFAPHAQDLLRDQANYLKSIAGLPGVVNCYDFVDDSVYSFAKLEYVSGSNLRRAILDNRADISFFQKLLALLENLDHNTKYRGHGDLKPENIIISDDRITLIDPGFYGRMRARDGRELSAAVTTLSYYPELRPNDIWAAGFILWEIACGEHILKNTNTVEANLGETLSERLNLYESTGNHNLTALRFARAPHVIRNMSPALSAVVAKAVGLVFSDNKVDYCGPYKSFTEFRKELAAAL